MECIDFFTKNCANNDKCKLLQDIPEDKLTKWEYVSASKYSPGPVTDNEYLCRQVISPIHYDKETNTLAATAFDDASNKGLSVNRLCYVTGEKVVQMANDRTEKYNELYPNKPQRTFVGSVHFSCRDIRKITITEEGKKPIRGFAIYDTANENDSSHADICQIVKNKAHGRSVRFSIRELANKYLGTNPFCY